MHLQSLAVAAALLASVSAAPRENRRTTSWSPADVSTTDALAKKGLESLTYGNSSSATNCTASNAAVRKEWYVVFDLGIRGGEVNAH